MRVKRTWRIIAAVLEALVLLLVAATCLLQSASVQTRLVQKATTLAGKYIDAEVSVSSIHLLPFRTIVVKDLLIKDKGPVSLTDTALYIRHASATISYKTIADAVSGRSFKKGGGGFAVDRLKASGVELNLIIEDRGNGHQNNFDAMFRLTGAGDTLVEKPDLFSIRRAYASDFRYRMYNPDMLDQYKGFGINWFDVDLTADARGRNINYVNSVCSMQIDRLSGREKSGYRILNARGNAVTGMGLTRIWDFHADDGDSELNMEEYTMRYNSLPEWADYVHKIVMGGVLRPSKIAMRSVAYYSGVLEDCPFVFDIRKGRFSGPVDQLHVDGLDCTELWSGAKLIGSASADGLVHIPDIRWKMDIDRLDFTTGQLEKIIGSFVSDSIPAISQYAKGMDLSLSARIDAQDKEIHAGATLSADGGSMDLKADLGFNEDKSLEYSGTVTMDEFDLKAVSGIEPLGPTSARIVSHGSIKENTPAVYVDTLQFSKLTVKDYPYTAISGKASYNSPTFRAWVKANDPSLNFLLEGAFSKSATINDILCKFILHLGIADLEAMNLDTRGGESTVSATMTADLRIREDRTIIGDASISDLLYTDHNGDHLIKQAKLNSILEKNGQKASFTSDFANAFYRGDMLIIDAYKDILATTLGRNMDKLPLIDDSNRDWSGKSFEATLRLKDTRDIFSIIGKDIYIASGTALEASIDREGIFKASLESERLALDNKFLKDMKLSVSGTPESTRLDLNSERLNLGAFEIMEPQILLASKDNGFTGQLSLKGSSEETTDLLLQLNGELGGNGEDGIVIDMQTTDSHFTVEGDRWEISESEIHLEDGLVSVYGLNAENGRQNISVDGEISSKINSTLTASIESFDLSAIEKVIGKEFGVGGVLDAELAYSTPSSNNAGLEFSLSVPELTIAERSFGKLEASAFLDDEDDLLNFRLDNNTGNFVPAISLSGKMDMNTRSLINTYLSLNEFDPAPAQPLLKDFVSELSASISGKMKIQGKIDKPQISSQGFNISSGKVSLIPTGASYSFNGSLDYDENGLLIQSLDIYDKSGGHAYTRDGRIPSTEIFLDRFAVLNKKNTGDMFYGNLALSGNLKLTAAEDLISVDARLANAGVSEIMLGLSSASAQDSGILTFEVPEEESNTEEKLFGETRKKQNSRFAVDARCNLSVSPDLTLRAELDKDGTNNAVVNGKGEISLGLNSNTGKLSLGGDYNVNYGKLHLSALIGIIGAEFTVSEGSSVKFAGDPMDTEVDINAISLVKAPIGPLISDTTSVSTRKEVECGLRVYDKIREPKIAMSINVKDLDPATQALVDSELNTEDKVQRQFLYLMLTNSFLPSNLGGITNQSNSAVVKTLASMASGQVNQMLQRMGVPLDVLLRYDQNEIGKDVVDLAMSTQLFDNKVAVNGSVGNRKYSSTSDDGLVGDIDIEVKLDSLGQLRMKAFSHSADDYTYYLDNSQRNGLGITYQIEYDNFFDMIRGLFRKKPKDPVVLNEKKTIYITNE